MRFSDGSSDVCSSDLDSEGENGGFEASGPDIAAAIPAFRAAAPQLTRIVAFGNCAAASALLLHRPLPLDDLILANHWTYERSEDDESAAPTSQESRVGTACVRMCRSRWSPEHT